MSNDREYPEGHDVMLDKGPCEKCGGSKCLATYADGHKHCHKCGHHEDGDGEGSGPRLAYSKPAGELLDPSAQIDAYRDLTKRKLTGETLRKYGVFQAGHRGEQVQVYPYYSMAGELVAQKLRTAAKDFPVLKGDGYSGIGESQLFGRHVFGDRFDRQVVVTEGELDALSVAQATNFKTAVVSIGAGVQSATKNLKANYLWLDRFAEIVLWFDNDEPGKKAIAECAPLFKVGKVRIATATGFKANSTTEKCKDASDVLQANRPGDIQAAIYAATAWRPAGIVNAKDNPEDVLAPKDEDHAFSFEWPWHEVTNTLGPILPGQVTYHVAGTGIGKSTAVATIAFNVIAQGGKVGYLGFEGTRREIKMALIVVHSGKRVDIERPPDETMARLHEAAFGSGNMELFDPESAEWTMAALEGYIRYLAKGLDCQVIVIDPLSSLVALSDEQDERRALDKISMTTSVAAKQLGVHIQISHHLTRPEGTPHEEGAPTSINQIRGSGGLANFATFVIGHERNQQAEGTDWLLTQLRALKNRPRSKTGPMVTLEYSMETGQLSRSSRKFPSPGKGGGGKQSGGFGPVNPEDY